LALFVAIDKSAVMVLGVTHAHTQGKDIVENTCSDLCCIFGVACIPGIPAISRPPWHFGQTSWLHERQLRNPARDDFSHQSESLFNLYLPTQNRNICADARRLPSVDLRGSVAFDARRRRIRQFQNSTANKSADLEAFILGLQRCRSGSDDPTHYFRSTQTNAFQS
jgi:hypothetical protein